MHTRLLTFVCYAIMALFAMALTITSPLLPAITASFALSMAESGLIFTANFAGFVAFILVGGLLADRWGKQRVLAVALAGFTLAVLAMPLTSSFVAVCAVSFFIGGFGGILESQIGALITALNPERPSYYLNLSQVFFGMGAVVGPVAAGVLLQQGGGWRLCYMALGSLTLLITGLFVAIRAPQLVTTDRMHWSAFTALVGDRQFQLICVCMLLYTGAEVGSWGWMSTFLTRSAGFSIVESSVAVGVFWTAMTIGRLLCGWLTLRYPLRSIVIGLACASAAITLIAGFSSAKLAIWVLIAALGLAFSSQWPLIAAYGSERYTASSGIVFALLVGSGGLGTTVVPYLMGVIGERATIRAAMISPALLFLVITLIFWRFGRANAGVAALGGQPGTKAS
jgi:fucose permease